MTVRNGPVRRSAALISVLMAVLTAVVILAPDAGAVVVQVGPKQRAGVLPATGVNPTLIPGSYAKLGTAKKFAMNGNLDYNGGIVLHGEAPYLIFWDPTNQIAAADKALYERFFADSAHDSGLATNVYSVNRQFTDANGFANYSQSWDPTHAITDTQAFPTTGQCTEASFAGETACLFDGQIQTEIARVIAAYGLPTGETGQAPVYFVVTPPSVNSCFSNNSTCADNYYCAYHSGFADGSNQVLYAHMATIFDAQSPKGCQNDNNSAVQQPNGQPTADVNIKAMSHEFNETITDPNGDAWWNTTSGYENGDNCNVYGPSVDPNNGSNPNAFTPTLGGSASGTLFNQAMNGNHYYTQSEWSNGNVNCRMQPSASALNAAFTGPTAASQGALVSFDPSGSSTAGGYTSTSWDFGDGSTSFARSTPATVTHAFSTGGPHTVTLTVVDKYGNLSKISHTVTTPTAAFTTSPSEPKPGSTVSFDGINSTGAGSPIASYSWNFGDGSSTGTGATPSHSYTSAGVYTVTLAVTDGNGRTGSLSKTVDVFGTPSAAFSVTTTSPTAGSPVAFDGSASNQPGGSISSYSWSFGDGSTAGSGAAQTHTYAARGTYDVTLAVTGADGQTGNVSHAVTVAAAPDSPPGPAGGKPTAVITVGNATPTAGQADSFSGAQSSDVGCSISSYRWSFGDGGTGTEESLNHAYSRTGSFTVTLTVTDATGATATATKTINVKAPTIASISVKKGKKIEKLTLVVTGPGTLSVGKLKFKIKQAGKFVYKLKLSNAQRGRLTHHQSVKIKLTFKFKPTVGSSSTRKFSFTVKG